MRLRKSAKVFLLIISAAAVALAAGVAIPLQEFPIAAEDPGSIVVDNITIVDPRLGTASASQSIVISGNRISYAGPAASAPHSQGAKHVDGSGKYAIPGLWDVHIHTVALSPQLHFPLLLANGITAVRDMGEGCSFSGDLDCVPEAPVWRRRIAAGALIGPRIVATTSYHVEDAVDGDMVARLKARGDDFIKVQLDGQADPAILPKLIADATAKGMRVAGHLPFTADLLDPRMGTLVSVEHDLSLLPQCSVWSVPFDGRNRSKDALLDRADTARRNAVLDAMASHGTAYVPTHVASSGQDWLLLSGNYRQDERVKYVPLPQRLLWRGYAAVTLAGTDDADRAPLERTYRASHELTKRAAMRGVAVMAGSDAIDAYIAHGFGLHDELNELVLAGLSPAEALRAATWTPARHFGLERDLGTIETGKLADLLLLANNPLEDIANAHNIDTVISNGKLYRRKDLDAMLAFTASQASSYSVASKFLWAMLKP